MIARTIKFTSVYHDGEEVERVEIVILHDRADMATEDAWNDHLEEILWPLTGTGREDGDAGYFAESIDGVEPTINVEWC